MSGLADRLETVRGEIADAARGSGRHPNELTMIVVTKFHPVSLIGELADLGVRDVGENRHPEAAEKAHALSSRGLTWHFVGQLQRKKARAVRAYTDVIHSVDRPELASALASEESIVDCFVQVNLTEDPARGGVDPVGLDPLVERILLTPGLRLLGVMAVAPLTGEPRSAFARLRRISDRVRQAAPKAVSISAGMSADFADAIAEGATHLRIGAAITGKRPDHG